MKKAIAVTLAVMEAAATFVAGALFGLLPRAHADGGDNAFITTLAKHCNQSGFTATTTIRQIIFHAP